MNKEPIGLYIFRLLLGFGLFAFMCLLYWSSTLIEDDLRSMRSDMGQLKNDLFMLRSEAEKNHIDILQMLPKQKKNDSEKKHNLDEASYPNLLHNDPFFATTLPKLLGKDFQPLWTQHTATIGKPDTLHPFSNWSQVAAWYDRCIANLSQLEFGKYETLAPDMAVSIEERTDQKTGTPEFWIHLRDHVYWEPLQLEFFPPGFQLAPQFLHRNQVTAEDFKFYYDALMNSYVQEPGAVSLRTYYGSIEEVKVIDKLTFTIRWQSKEILGRDGKKTPRIKYIAKSLTGALKPLPCFVYKYFSDGTKIISDDSDPNTYRTNSVWAQNFAEHWAKNIIVSCGAWIFDGMNERQIRFTRNPNFYFPYAALTAAIETEFKDTPENIWEEFQNGHLDSYGLQPDQLSEYKKFLQSPAYKRQVDEGNSVKRLDYVARTYTYIGWNQAKPYFKSAKVRRAMTMAIDRRRIIENYLNGLGVEITGTFFRYSSAYDPSISPWPYSPEEARRLLAEEGWYDSTGNGVVDKLIDGKRIPMKFTLTYYVKNPTLKSVCEYVSTALKEIGVDCSLLGVDIADLSAVFDDKSFDAVCLAWSLGNPPEDPRQLWHSSGAKEKGSSNAIGFANQEIDDIIDKLDYEYDRQKRIALYHRFNAIIHEEQPYTFLYTPKVALLSREYLQNVFIPADRQDLIPGATVAEPDPNIFWIKRQRKASH